ncbi:MAG: EF-P lysine aminoacylase GenX [Halioglobus sp.]|nr:EF-P lysine aminoacylase GenX [Halioglobus sp.]
MKWQPAAEPDTLRQRALLLDRVRRFFKKRHVLEVETPLLCQHGVTDPAIEAYQVTDAQGDRYLQTSPEYAMKRLLASCDAPLFQICRVFRKGEVGPRHNPEFSLLEWYQPGFDHHQLMNEVAELVIECLGKRPIRKKAYRDLFLETVQIDPFTDPVEALQNAAHLHLDTGALSGDRDLWLDLLMSHVIEPQLDGLYFVYDYPASQAALANIVSDGGVRIGQRFELYVDGMELANGYCELTDVREQRRRFIADNALRRKRGQLQRSIDGYLLAALEHGLPECSGVALGIDRLLMLQVGADDIRDVLAFDWGRA